MSKTEANPFQAPIETNVQAPVPVTDKPSLDFIVIAKKWERYRLVYNGILVFESILLSLMLSNNILVAELMVVAIFGVVVVNFFFLLGPAMDGYCQWISDSRSEVYGMTILVLGTLFSMLLTAGVIFSMTPFAFSHH